MKNRSKPRKPPKSIEYWDPVYDVEMVKKHLAGDTAATEYLYKRLNRMVYKIYWKIEHRMKGDYPDDFHNLITDVTNIALLALSKVDLKKNVFGYLTRTIINEFYQLNLKWCNHTKNMVYIDFRDVIKGDSLMTHSSEGSRVDSVHDIEDLQVQSAIDKEIEKEEREEQTNRMLNVLGRFIKTIKSSQLKRVMIDVYNMIKNKESDKIVVCESTNNAFIYPTLKNLGYHRQSTANCFMMRMRKLYQKYKEEQNK